MSTPSHFLSDTGIDGMGASGLPPPGMRKEMGPRLLTSAHRVVHGSSGSERVIHLRSGVVALNRHLTASTSRGTVSFSGTGAERAQAPMNIQRLVMGDRLPAIQAAGVRNAVENRLQMGLAVFERP